MTENTRLFLRRTCAVALTVVLAGSMFIPKAGAIGISPPIIQASDVLRNSSQTYSVTVLIDRPIDRDVYFNVAPRGEYGHYLSGASEFVIPAGKTSAVYTFDLEPIDAPVGSYNLQLVFTEKQKAQEEGDGAAGNGSGAKVAVLQGAVLVISMGVTGEERVGYEIQRLQFNDTEPRIPLSGTYTMRNTGNVEWKPERIEVTAYEIEDPENTSSYTVEGEDIPLVKPGKTLDAKLSIPHDLIEGRYRANAKFFYKGEQIAELESTPFNVFQVGTLDQSGELIDVSTNKDTYRAGEKVVVQGTFKNTGDVTVEGKMETIIYKDGEFINIEVSQPLSIDRKQESEFRQFLTLSDPGTYTLEVSVDYGNRKTDVRRLTINVGSAPIGQASSVIITVILIVLFVIGVIIFLILFARRKKQEQKEVQGGPASMPKQPVTAVTQSEAVTPPPVPISAPVIEGQAVAPQQAPLTPSSAPGTPEQLDMVTASKTSAPNPTGGISQEVKEQDIPTDTAPTVTPSSAAASIPDMQDRA